MTVGYRKNRKQIQIWVLEVFPEEKNLQDEFSELILGFLDSFSMNLKALLTLFLAEDEVVSQHHQLNGHEFEQTLGG